MSLRPVWTISAGKTAVRADAADVFHNMTADHRVKFCADVRCGHVALVKTKARFGGNHRAFIRSIVAHAFRIGPHTQHFEKVPFATTDFQYPTVMQTVFLDQSIRQRSKMFLKRRRATLAVFVIGVIRNRLFVQRAVENESATQTLRQTQIAARDAHRIRRFGETVIQHHGLPGKRPRRGQTRIVAARTSLEWCHGLVC